MADRQGFVLPPDLQAVKITGLPSTAYYISDFISEPEERYILDRIASVPKPRWTQLTHRRLQAWPSDLVKDTLLNAALPPWLEDPIISRLLSLTLAGRADCSIPFAKDVHASESDHMFSQSPHHRPNHVLVNEYPPGVGIMPHKDGAAYWPVVCTVSLGASLCLNVYRSKEDGVLDSSSAWRILQEPRSLLITTDSLYTDHLHGIADVKEDSDLCPETIANWSLLRSPEVYLNGRNIRQTRTSLTYRDVLRVSNIGKQLRLLQNR